MNIGDHSSVVTQCSEKVMSVADADRRNSDVSAMLAALQKQVDELTNQTRRLQTILRLEDATVVDREMKLTRQRSQGDNIRDLTPREAESISVVFKKFCEPGKELVNLDFLQQVYEKLGEPLTAKEAHRAKTSIRSAVPNHVSLEEFLNFWKLDHARSDRYFERFKLSSAQIKTAAFDLDRIVRSSTFFFRLEVLRF